MPTDPGTTGRPLVFVSHSSEDRDELVSGVVANLRSRGLNVWVSYEPDAIPFATAHDEQIPQAIARSSAVVCLVTENAVRKSTHLLRELRLADNAESPVVLVIVEPDRVKNLPEWHSGWSYHATNQYLECERWTDATTDALAKRLIELAGVEARSTGDVSASSTSAGYRLLTNVRIEALRAAVTRFEDSIFQESDTATDEARRLFQEVLRAVAHAVLDDVRAEDIDEISLPERLNLTGDNVGKSTTFLGEWPDPGFRHSAQQIQRILATAPARESRKQPPVISDLAKLVAWIERHAVAVPDATMSTQLEDLVTWLGGKSRHRNLIFLRPPSAAAAQSLEDWSGVTRGLKEVIGDGSFTAVLGAGVEQIGPGDQEVVLDSDLVENLRKDQSSSGRSLLDFYTEVVRQRLEGRALRYRPVLQAGVDAQTRFAFWEVQHALLRVAHDSTDLLLKALARDTRPIRDWSSLDVRITDTRETADAFASHLKTAIQGLRNYSENFPRLGAAALAARLDAIAKELGSRRDFRLSGAEIEWLTDVFWHSLSFHTQVYPRTDELALQVALVQESTLERRPARPRRHLEPAAIVLRRDAEGVARATADAVGRGFDPRSRGARRDFHTALAQALYAEYGRWAPLAGGMEPAAGRRGRPPMPLVLTTSFSLEVERALAVEARKEGGAERYHVVIPVVSIIDPLRVRVLRGELRWMIGTFGEARSEQPSAEELSTPVRWTWADQMGPQPALKGPVVLKLNGSPLHRLVAVSTEVASSGAKHKPAPSGPPVHGVILGEYDYLQFFRVEHALYTLETYDKRPSTPGPLPQWLVAATTDPRRSWFLLGTRLVDWNSRMQVFMQASRARGSGIIAIQRRFDADRLDFLEALGVQRVTGDLDDLSLPLRDYAEALRERAGSVR